MAVCAGCGKWIRKGEGRYTAAEPEYYWHWSCKEEAREKVGVLRARVPEIWIRIEEQLKRYLRR